MKNDIYKLRAKLCDLFPHEDPNSSWMLRLAILRDDFEYEIIPKGDREGDPTGVWLSVYQSRKLAITIGEVKNIFSSDVAKFIETQDGKWSPALLDGLEAAIRAVNEADAVYGPLRDTLGAHVRPANAVQIEPRSDPTPGLLKRHEQEEFEVTLDLKTGSKTSLHYVSAAAFIFALPGVSTEEEYVRFRLRMHETFLACFNAIRHGIDLLLAMQWQKAGLIP